MANTFLSLENLTIRYPDLTVYKHVNFEIKAGEQWALMGDHTSLKTAILDVMAGKATALDGKMNFTFFDEYVRNNQIEDHFLSPQPLISYVSYRHNFKTLSNTTNFYYQQRFNSTDSENSLTVEEYLSNVHGYRNDVFWTYEKVVNDLHLNHLLHENVIKLSNGETKRLLLAEALLRHPLLLLLDNPFAGLDVQSRKEISLLIDKIGNTGITVVITTSPGEIPEGITHVSIINQNKAITAFPKGQFSAENFHHSTVKLVDVAALKSLLSLASIPVYSDIIHMKDVSIRYGEKVILDKINWTVKQGERWALVGPNGAGKSTLLSLINADNPQAFANHIILFDRKKGSGESIWDIKKKIGFFSPELYQYFPVDTNCLQTVESGFFDTIGLFRSSHPYTASIALRWMKLFGIDTITNKLLRNVSMTEQRLCLLARALVKTPPLLILDEPLQGFDEEQQEYFKSLIDLVCDYTNTTLIYVTHYTHEQPTCINKMFCMDGGKQVVGRNP